jgi:hypothetical protein
MFKFALFMIFFLGHTENKQVDTIVKWSEDYRLSYTDFVRKQASTRDSAAQYDTLALIDCFIKYEIKIQAGKRLIHAYAAMNYHTSWMKIENPDVLKHEQGHFDLTEIYARRFEKAVNDTSIHDVHDYFVFLTDSFKATMDELKGEHEKYDAWTMNPSGKEYYYKWINEQLFSPK